MRCLILSFLMASISFAATISSFSLATDLIGGTVSVTHFGGGGMSSATFVAGPGGSAVASSPGSAGFSLTVTPGDTFFSLWTLTNTDPTIILFNHITAMSIDLTGSVGGALFDNDSVPSSIGSFAGILGVLFSAGTAIATSGEVNLWTDPLNAGDMFTGTNITFGGGGIGPLGFSSWTDDTDSTAIPEPATTFLIGVCLLMTFVSSRRVWTSA